MSKKRLKRMSKAEIEKLIRRYKWAPRLLAESQYPELFKNIPKEKVSYMAVSGSFNDVRGEDIIGGIDVFRRGQKDSEKGIPLKKDHYTIIIDNENLNFVIVKGPFRDHEHWLSTPPDWLRKAEYYPYDSETK
jgi:hypothetical protein